MIKIKAIVQEKSYDIEIQSTAMLSELKQTILKHNNSNSNQTITNLRLGFPPITYSGTEMDNKSLKELKITNNELIRAEIGQNTNINTNNNTNNLDIERKIILADNSCLFNAVNYAINKSTDEPDVMRQLIASEIFNNLDVYNQAVLEKDPNEYCDWILDSKSWGGGIEIAILSKAFQITIGVMDIQSGQMQFFGENYDNIIYLLYDGIHYDVFVKLNYSSKDPGIFRVTDTKTLDQVKQIGLELKNKNRFTDTKNFKIKCNICYTLLQGNSDAVEHSKQTGHTNFVQLDN